MVFDIDPIPKIPDELRIASKEGRLVLFVGAGASKLAGCPGWSVFADRALASLGLHNVNHALLDQIQNQGLGPRIKLALALDWAKEADVVIDFEQILHPPDWQNHKDGNRLYQALNSLGRMFVTTNYDYWLDQDIRPTPQLAADVDAQPVNAPRIRRDVIYRPDDMRISMLHRDNVITVIHLHGSLADPKNMILTTGDYIARYGQLRGSSGLAESNMFLEDLFHMKNILFIGYGLDELEILEYVILKKGKRNAESQQQAPKHFILQPFFSHERDVASGIANYFKNQCGVTLIPFLRDTNNYAQLIDVIEYFAREIPVATMLNVERRTYMDGLLENE